MAWKDIPSYEGLYEINELGEIRSNYFFPPKVLHPSKDKDGYLIISLSKEWSKENIQGPQTCSFYFLPINNEQVMTVNHKDENKENNSLKNLEWMTQKDNCNYGTRNIRQKQNKGKRIIDTYTGKIYHSIKEASDDLGYDSSYIVKVCKHKVKTQGKYRWEYYVGDKNGT